MSYNTIYTIPFKTITDKYMSVEILKEDYTGTVTELTGSSTPFITTIDDDDFLYIPLRFSTASMGIVGGDYLQSLFSTNYQQYKVNLHNNGVIVWTGFISPEIYTQDYAAPVFEFSVECMSAMSTLEFIDYKKQGEKYAFISLFDLIKICVEASRGSYNSIFIPHVYAKDSANYSSMGNVLSEMFVSEQNFFDEDIKPMKLKEVLEEVCKFLNWTCVDWNGDLYFVDVDHFGEYYKYTPDLGSYETRVPDSKKVQEIGFAGAEHSFDIIGGYNKASVKASNYNVGELFPEEDFDNLDFFCNTPDVVDKNKVQEKKYFTSRIFKTRHWYEDLDYGDAREISDEVLPNFKTKPLDILGIMPIWRCTYNMKNGNGGMTPDINEYNWEKIYQYKIGIKQRSTSRILMEFKNQLPLSSFEVGMALCISCSIQCCKREDMVEWDNKIKNDSGILVLPCDLSIGKRYWNGRDWTGDSTASFNIEFDKTKFIKGEWVQCKNTKTLQQAYEGLNGCLIPVTRFLTGDIKFRLWAPKEVEDRHCIGIFIKDLMLESAISDMDSSKDNSDRIYENVVNENYINELDEIEFKISSYNSDESSYSKVILNDKFLSNNLYSSITGSNERPEELLIKRIVSQYRTTKIKLTQVLKYSDISPFTTMYDNYMVNKKFILTGGEIDYINERFTCKMIQNDNY